MSDAREALESATIDLADSIEFEDKQEARKQLCKAMIDNVHEDVAWSDAMQSAMDDHRRDEFPCF